uniref:Rho-GAP domain-containing protein n=1 Tax=Glossina pallidipes TaxID=7398 RepID=A0A1A9ZTE3_GLOPL
MDTLLDVGKVYIDYHSIKIIVRNEKIASTATDDHKNPTNNGSSTTVALATNSTQNWTSAVTEPSLPDHHAVEQEHTSSLSLFSVICVIMLGILLIHVMLQSGFQYLPESIVVFLGALIGLFLKVMTAENASWKRKEARGLQEKGKYRVSGSEREVKALKGCFLENKTIPHLGGCIKDFLCSLSEPLVPRTLRETFCYAVQNQPEEDIVRHLTYAISRLPHPHRDTLAFLILHFQRVAESPEVSMSLKNLARVYVPTMFGNSSDLEQGSIWAEIYAQCTIMENLLKVRTKHWIPYVSLETEKENSQNSTNLLRTPSWQNKDIVYSLYGDLKSL